jgi:hypothetical protein
MNKIHEVLIVLLALTLLFTGIALTTSSIISTTSDVIIYAFDQNPVGSDEGNEWVTFHNPSNKSVDIGNWTFETRHGSIVSVWIAEGTTLYPGAYCTYTPHYQWLGNSEEAIILRNANQMASSIIVAQETTYGFVGTISSSLYLLLHL